MKKKRRLKKELFSPFKHFLRDYSLWQNCITAAVLPINIFFMIAVYGFTFTPAILATITVLGSLFIWLAIIIAGIFKRTKTDFVDPKYSLFFGLGLFAVIFTFSFFSLHLIEQILIALSPAPFIFPLLLSPLSVYLSQRAPRTNQHVHYYNRSITRNWYVFAAVITGYLSQSNVNFFFSLPITVYNALLGLMALSSFTLMPYIGLFAGAYLGLFAVAGILYSHLMYRRLYKISQSAYAYLFFFALGLTLISTLHLIGAPVLLISNCINIAAFIIFSIVGSVYQGRKQATALHKTDLQNQYEEIKFHLDQAKLNELKSELKDNDLFKNSVLVLSPVPVKRADDNKLVYYERSTLRDKLLFSEPHISNKKEMENINALDTIFSRYLTT